jgi:hypothetical protein
MVMFPAFAGAAVITIHEHAAGCATKRSCVPADATTLLPDTTPEALGIDQLLL